MIKLVEFTPTGAVCVIVGRGQCGWNNSYLSLREVRTGVLVAAMESQIAPAPVNVVALPTERWHHV